MYGTRDFFQWAQRTRTGREANEEVDKLKTINDLTRRLSQPKAVYNFKVRSLGTTKGTLQGLKEKLMYQVEPKLTQSKSSVNSPYYQVESATQKEEIKRTPRVQAPSRGSNSPSLLIRHQKAKSAVLLSPKMTLVEGVRSVKGI